jgi:hypothetical protein
MPWVIEDDQRGTGPASDVAMGPLPMPGTLPMPLSLPSYDGEAFLLPSALAGGCGCQHCQHRGCMRQRHCRALKPLGLKRSGPVLPQGNWANEGWSEFHPISTLDRRSLPRNLESGLGAGHAGLGVGVGLILVGVGHTL